MDQDKEGDDGMGMNEMESSFSIFVIKSGIYFDRVSPGFKKMTESGKQTKREDE